MRILSALFLAIFSLAFPAVATPVFEPIASSELSLTFPAAGALLRHTDGNFYGVCGGGGAAGSGGLFRLSPAGEFTVLVSFTGTAGSNPGAGSAGALVSDSNGVLWGMTGGGGSAGYGTVFTYNVETGVHTTVVQFTGADTTAAPGQGPRGALCLDAQGNLWGVTEFGGISSNGTVFRINPATGEFTSVFRFTGTSGALPGSRPRAGLYRDASNVLWGTTSDSGSGAGRIIKIVPTAPSLVTVAQLTGTAGANPGQAPRAELVPDDAGNLWGSATAGSAAGYGNVFKYSPALGTYTEVIKFTGASGAFPGTACASRLWNDGNGFMWGTTEGDDSPQVAANVFKVNIATGAYTVVQTFTGNTGAVPGELATAGLTPDEAGNLFGATSSGGVKTYGTLYKINRASGAYTLLKEFHRAAVPGFFIQPVGGLISDWSGRLWGTSALGGFGAQTFFGSGTVFNLDLQSRQVSMVAEFDLTQDTRGKTPQAETYDDGMGSMWVTTTEGGSSSHGTVYRLNQQTGALTHVVTFNNAGWRGYAPLAGFVNDGNGFIWSTTLGGGTPERGVIYKIRLSDARYYLVAEFTGDTGAIRGAGPTGTLVPDGKGFFWGVTGYGGTQSVGTIFKVNIATGAVTNVVNFTGQTGAFAGDGPTGKLVLDGSGNFWGTTQSGGANGMGTAFSINPTTGAFSSRLSFSGIAGAFPGSKPYAGLTNDEAGNLWGTTNTGGTNNFGTVFRIDATGNFSSLFHFTNLSGAVPGKNPSYGSLLRHGDGFLYGVTPFGGVTADGRPAGGGQIYRIRMGPTAIQTLDATSVGVTSATLAGSANPNNAPVTFRFAYGTNPDLGGAAVTSPTTLPASDTPVTGTRLLTGLLPATTYCYRTIVTTAENSAPQSGAVLSFTTAPDLIAPVITIRGSNDVTTEAPAAYVDAGADASNSSCSTDNFSVGSVASSSGIGPAIAGWPLRCRPCYHVGGTPRGSHPLQIRSARR